MKLLVIAPHYHTFVKDLVEAQSKYLDEINVLVHHNYLSELAPYLPFSYFRYVEKFSKKRLIDLTNTPKNVRIHVISTLYFIPDARNYELGDKLLSSFKRYIKKNKIKFDLIHAHFTWPSGHVGARLKEEYDTSLIVTAHGYDIYVLPFKDKKWKKKIRYVLNSANHVLTVSNENLSLIKRLNVTVPVTIVPNGFRSDLFYPRDQLECRKILRLPRDRKIILTVGNLVEVKGHKYLIDALVNVVEHRKDILCIVVGGGELENKLKGRVRSIGLENYVKIIGLKPHNEIPLWMNAADLFVLPSLNEGNPTVLFESLGVGLPFVGTAVGGIPEIITSEDHGLLCPPKDEKCLAAKILIALEKEWNKKKIRKYAEQFTWEDIAKKIVNIYKKMIKDKTRKRSLDNTLFKTSIYSGVKP